MNEIQEISRNIPQVERCKLWARAAGRCEFKGCNRLLYRSSVTQEDVNVAQQAHIYSFSPQGPRGQGGLSPNDRNNANNLMLVCHECHRKLDQKTDGGRYTASLLHAWKREHEARVEIVTGISSDRKSHVLLYGAGIDEHRSPLNFTQASEAMFPTRYPAKAEPIEIPILNGVETDKDASYWQTEEKQLLGMFERRVRERLTSGEITHLSVFGLAPQPLLIRLGTLLTDIADVDVYQLHREPKTWEWQEQETPNPFFLREPNKIAGAPALVISLSSPISYERIRAVLPNASIWEISVENPHNDFLRSSGQLREFRQFVRKIFAKIKEAHGQREVMHIFPAMPVAMAIELGRVRQAKADLTMKIYDQINKRGGFVNALIVGEDYGE